MDRRWKVYPRRMADGADWPFRWDAMVNRSVDRAAVAPHRPVVDPERSAVALDWPKWRAACATIAADGASRAPRRVANLDFRPHGLAAWSELAVCNVAEADRKAQKARPGANIVDSELRMKRTALSLS